MTLGFKHVDWVIVLKRCNFGVRKLLAWRKVDKNFLILITGLFLGGTLGFFSNRILSGNFLSQNSQSILFEESSGMQAINFSLETIEGEAFELIDLKGKPILINFWATWCGPCQVEMPLLQEYYENYHPDLEILAINYDESNEVVELFRNKFGLTFPILLDRGGKVADLYQVRAFPTTYFIDRDGMIQGVHIGTLFRSLLEAQLQKIGVNE